MAILSLAGAQATLTTSYKTALTISCASSNARRFKIFDINIAAQGAPASTDTNIQFDLSKHTAAGTNTATTLIAADLGDSYWTSVGGANNTVEPTGPSATAGVFNIAMNQRAPFRWQTYLGSGAELIFPATANNGASLRALSAGYTGAAGGTIYFMEC